MTDRHAIPRHLDDPELIGFWTIDEFAGIIVPFTWGILAQHRRRGCPDPGARQRTQ